MTPRSSAGRIARRAWRCAAAVAGNAPPGRGRRWPSAGAGPALVARLGLGLPRHPALADPGRGRRFHPRVPGGGCRYLDLWRPGGRRARGSCCPARRTGDDRQRQRPGADVACGSGVDNRAGLDWHSIAPGKPQQNAFVESFIGRLRDELLKKERFEALAYARRLIECWRQDYNQVWPDACSHRAQAPAINPSDSPHERGASGEQVMLTPLEPRSEGSQIGYPSPLTTVRASTLRSSARRRQMRGRSSHRRPNLAAAQPKPVVTARPSPVRTKSTPMVARRFTDRISGRARALGFSLARSLASALRDRAGTSIASGRPADLHRK
jgi:Integrase core domain